MHWNLARDEWRSTGGGHVMKLRYTSLQADTGVAEEGTSGGPVSLGGMAVVAIGVHSQLAPVAAAFKHAGGRRLAYVMTDAGALPLAISDLVAALCDRGLLTTTITAGQAFGGAMEAVNVPSALALAREVSDAVVVGTGPGVVGTGTRLGTSALEVASILDTSAALDGKPIVCVRASGADQRDRHRGVSHHTRTALELVRSRVFVAIPEGFGISAGGRHQVRTVAVPDMVTALRDFDVDVRTMGRTPEEDPEFFAVAGAAGALAAE